MVFKIYVGVFCGLGVDFNGGFRDDCCGFDGFLLFKVEVFVRSWKVSGFIMGFILLCLYDKEG